MNTVPVRQIPSGASKAAVSASGNSATSTLAVANSLQGVTRVMFSLTVAAGADVADVAFLKGCWDTSRAAAKAGVTFTSKVFPDYASFMQYFTQISTAVTRISLSSTDVNNFQSTLTFTEMQPGGKKSNVDLDLRPYRQNVGGGYGETIEIKDFPFVQWNGQEIMISNIKGGSTIDFTFEISGWNKSKDLMALTAQTI
jgi:hypothetical protein